MPGIEPVYVFLTANHIIIIVIIVVIVVVVVEGMFRKRTVF